MEHCIIYCFLIRLQASAIEPVQGDIRLVGSCLFRRVSPIFYKPFEQVTLQIFRKSCCSIAHQYKKHAYILRNGNLIVIPVITCRTHRIPISQTVYYCIIQILVAIERTSFCHISLYHRFEPAHMLQGNPFGSIGGGRIVYI